MKTIELVKSGNSESLGDYDYEIGQVVVKDEGSYAIVRVSIEHNILKDEVESFIENLKELVRAK